MSNRTRPFFANGGRKPKPFYNRPNQAAFDSAEDRPRDPIEASAESKQKLREFHFTPYPPPLPQSNSTVSTTSLDTTGSTSVLSAKFPIANVPAESPGDSDPPNTATSRSIQSTTNKGFEMSTQADEQLSWGLPTLTQDLFRPESQKRPRSSSPDASATDPVTPHQGRRTIVKATPGEDVVPELWEHYGRRGRGRSSGDSMNSASGNSRASELQTILDNGSSPMTPAGSRISGLRKWASAVAPSRVPVVPLLTLDESDGEGEGQDEVRVNLNQENSVSSRRAHSEYIRLQPTRSKGRADDEDFFSDNPDDFDELISIVATQVPTSYSASPCPAAGMPSALKETQPAMNQASQHFTPNSQAVSGFGDIEGELDDVLNDDFDIEDDVLAELSGTQAQALAQAKEKDKAALETGRWSQAAPPRFTVQNITEGTWINQHGHQNPERILSLTCSEVTNVQAHLRQSWYESPVSVGAIVNIIGEFNAGVCIVDNDRNYIVVYPDQLLSATHVADAFTCMRRAVLQGRVKATSSPNERLIRGSVLHQLLQEGMTAGRWTRDWLLETLDRILPLFYQQIAELEMDLTAFRENIIEQIPQLQKWAAIYLGPRLTPKSRANDRGQSEIPLVITKLLDVEEHLWSPKFGLKGNVDATVEALLEDQQGTRKLVLPLELKTGKGESIGHRAQTVLYTLLLAERYDVDIENGILFYLERMDMSRVRAIRTELIHMLIARNELVMLIAEKKGLPSILKQNRLCEICYSQQSCFAYHKVENGDGRVLTERSQEHFETRFGNVTPAHAEFFRAWDKLLTLEEGDTTLYKELWSMSSTQREERGNCFARMTLEKGSDIESSTAGKINRFQYSFLRSSDASRTADSEIGPGEPIVISDENGHYCLAKGFAVSMEGRKVTVAVDRRLHNSRIRLPGFDSERNQVFTGLREYTGRRTTDEESQGAKVQNDEGHLYRIDRDEYASGMATLRNNMVQLLDDNVSQSGRLRQLVIDKAPPRFGPKPSLGDMPNLNEDQKEAVEKILSAQDYALVLGMPGTGKTTTIAHILKVLVRMGKSVLLTSYTHTAVDNILLKLRGAGFEILRLGVRSKIHPGVQEFATMSDQQFASPEEVRSSWMRPPVVASTSLGISHPIFSQRKFDICIVDEASQITLPGCVGPLRLAQTFVLVGDHYQLPPLVQNVQAAEGGLDESLFKRLCDANPFAVASLRHQYRMASDIMEIANALVYDGRLVCGNEQVGNQMLKLTEPGEIERFHSHGSAAMNTAIGASEPCSGNIQDCHLSKLLQPSSRVLFINTDTLGRPLEVASGDRRTNPTEAHLTRELLWLLLLTGVPASEIGVVTFYRSQLSLLKSLCRGPLAAVEMHTADRFQGRDKDVVIVSFVRSNEDGSIGRLLRDRRRLNVAVTRSRVKLVLVGSRGTLMTEREREEGQEEDILPGIVRICDERGWTVGARAGHTDVNFEIGQQAQTQTQTQTRKQTTAVTRKAGPSRGRAGDALLNSRPLAKEVFRDALGE